MVVAYKYRLRVRGVKLASLYYLVLSISFLLLSSNTSFPGVSSQSEDANLDDSTIDKIFFPDDLLLELNRGRNLGVVRPTPKPQQNVVADRTVTSASERLRNVDESSEPVETRKDGKSVDKEVIGVTTTTRKPESIESSGDEDEIDAETVENESTIPCLAHQPNGEIQPCVFPFRFGNRTYIGCTAKADRNRIPWCSTKVDENGVHVGGGGDWGHCIIGETKRTSLNSGETMEHLMSDCFVQSRNTQVIGGEKEDDDLSVEITNESDEGEEEFAICDMDVRSMSEEIGDDMSNDSESVYRCKPPTLCPTLTLEERDSRICKLSESDEGICCKSLVDKLNKEVMRVKLGVETIDTTGITSGGKSVVVKHNDDMDHNVTRLMNEAEKVLSGFNFLPQNGELEDTDEINALRFGGPSSSSTNNFNGEDSDDTFMNTTITPDDLLFRFNQPLDGARHVSFQAEQLLDAGKDIEEQWSGNEIGLRIFDSSTSDALNDACAWTPSPSCRRRGDSYRSLDGSCNNLKESNFGRALTPYQRILMPDYRDGRELPRMSKNRKDELPSARLVSTFALTNSQGSSSRRQRIHSTHTLLVMQMGQFIDHDLTSTPTEFVRGGSCCPTQSTTPITSFDQKKCFPIPVEINDPLWRGRKRCISFTRSLSSPGLKCNLELRQQMNQITHWLDGSNIYGSNEELASKLRTFTRGELKATEDVINSATSSSPVHGGNSDFEEYLPSCARARARSLQVQTCNSCANCFYAGDARANEQSNLLVIHTLWMREHNRIARTLSFLNPQWSDQKLFDEARKINVAQYQHIVYNEWLPIVLGRNFMNRFGLWSPTGSEYSDEYNENFDARITNEFASAAFRFGHSLIPESFHRTQRFGSGEGRVSTFRTINRTPLDVVTSYFRPDLINPKSNEDLLDELMEGMLNQPIEDSDAFFSSSVQDNLFRFGAPIGGLDLVAINIQRGRDHGLPGYNSYRDVCGSGRARSWSQLEDLIDGRDVDRLRQIYNDPDDIDLYVGGALEKKVEGSLLGPTFMCIIGDQFARLKLGDRYFYDIDPSRTGHDGFTKAQLAEIRKTSMARILCDNHSGRVVDKSNSRLSPRQQQQSLQTPIMQPNAFLMTSFKSNGLVNCLTSKTISRVNLEVFREKMPRGMFRSEFVTRRDNRRPEVISFS